MIATMNDGMATSSPPSRAAWIEMGTARKQLHVHASPPSRAAWIEMLYKKSDEIGGRVAAFTGGVD